MFQNFGPLFLVESCQTHEPDRLIFTCTSYDCAVEQVRRFIETNDSSEYEDIVKIRVISPGPGTGVVIARWYAKRPSINIWPTVMGADGWSEEAEGPPVEDPRVQWERVL